MECSHREINGSTLEALYCSRELRDKGNVTMQQREPAPGAATKGGLARAAGGAPATVWFAALSVAVYLALILSSGGPTAPISGRMALRWGALAGDLGWREPWRQLSAMFVHFGLLHIGFNVLALFSFGRMLERVLGSARFTVLLLLTGVLGFVASDVWYELFPPSQITGGLSGGIFGLLGAEVGLRLAARDAGWKRAAISGAGYALMMGLIPGQNVNNAAHVGGLLSGVLLGWALSQAASRSHQRLFDGAALLLSAATLGAIALCRWG